MKLHKSLMFSVFFPILFCASAPQGSAEYHAKGMQLLCAIAITGDVRAVDQALTNGADINYQKPETGDTPFHYLLRYQGGNRALLEQIMLTPRFNDTIKNHKGLTAFEELEARANAIIYK